MAHRIGSLDDVVVYLVPLGSGRFEFYSEPPDDPPSDKRPEGFFRRWMHRLSERWGEAVHSARHKSEPAAGRFALWRDWAVCRLAEEVAEQRTLWSLRQAMSATLVYSSELAEAAALAERNRVLAEARRHHGLWLIVDTLLFISSGVFFFIPGPNVFAYYFGIRSVGHYLSWRGARQASTTTCWETRLEPALAELGRLVNVPRDVRAARVDAIATELNLSRLAAFFDRAAVPGR